MAVNVLLGEVVAAGAKRAEVEAEAEAEAEEVQGQLLMVKRLGGITNGGARACRRARGCRETEEVVEHSRTHKRGMDGGMDGWMDGDNFWRCGWEAARRATRWLRDDSGTVGADGAASPRADF